MLVVNGLGFVVILFNIILIMSRKGISLNTEQNHGIIGFNDIMLVLA